MLWGCCFSRWIWWEEGVIIKIIKDLLKGLCIGIANIIPGFSGGTMAVLLHTYDRIIFGIADILKHPLKVIKDLLFIGIGMIIGFILAVVSISYLLKHYPMPTILFFVGLIIGGIPGVFKEARCENKSRLNALWIIPALVLIVSLPLINTHSVSADMNVWKYMALFVIGAVASSAMVIPGVSGSLILMIFGYYALILDNASFLMKNIFTFSGILEPILMLLVFAVGCIVGIVFISKLIKWLMGINKNAVEFFIIGLLLGSPFSIIYTVCKSDEYKINYGSVGMWICSAVLLIVGIVVPITMEILSKRIEASPQKESSEEL